MTDRLLDTKQVAEKLCTTRQGVGRLVNKGLIPFCFSGDTKRRFRESDIDNYITGLKPIYAQERG